MQHELSEILADVKEQILYLQELGVENLNVELPEFDGSKKPLGPALEDGADGDDRDVAVVDIWRGEERGPP